MEPGIAGFLDALFFFFLRVREFLEKNRKLM